MNATNETHAQRLTARLDFASRIVISRAGRSNLVGNFLAIRVMHKGYNVSVLSEIVTRAMQRSDLPIVISSSGKTQQLIAFSLMARTRGATIALITSEATSPIADVADEVFQISQLDSYHNVQETPLSTASEHSALCFLKALISHTIWEKSIPEDVMKTRHANLE